MREILITSSVLIAVIALVRTLLKGKISLRLQYGLWLLVALRLLVPVSLVQSPVSVMNVVTAVERVTEQVAPKAPQAPSVMAPSGEGNVSTGTSPAAPVAPASPIAPKAPVNAAEIAKRVWLAGIGAMAVWFLLSDVLFRRKLRRSAQRIEEIDCPLPVYVTAAVPSPCLYGLFRPAIYLTPDCVESEEALRHVLAHEETHYRHRDQIWSLVRCVCLAIYWFNPLVWLAAVLSRRDCELACDEGAIRTLGEVERLSYGRTLLSMVVPKSVPADLLRTATTMTSGKGGLQERIGLIAKRPKAVLAVLVAVALIVGVAVSCTFTGAKESKAPSVPIEEALAVLPDELKDSVVLRYSGSYLLLEAFYKEDYDTDWGGRLFEVARETPVMFEQGFQDWNEMGGATYLGKDENWYYVRYWPGDANFNPEHQAGYQAAYEAAVAWVDEVFSRYENMTPVENDPVYQALSGNHSYNSPHANVIYHPYYGLTNYGAANTDTAYTLLLSQPAKQGEGGIWCVDRWYDASGVAYLWLPVTDVTLAEYYADLQAKADAGEADWALNPRELCVKYVKEQFNHDRAPEAFQVGEIYEGEPNIESTVVTMEDGVKRRLEGILNGPDGGVFIALPGADGVTLSTRKLPLDPQMGNGPYYTRRMVEDYAWKDMAEPAYFNGGTLEPETYDWKVRIYHEGVGEFTVYQGSDIVRYDDLSSGTSWYEAASKLDAENIAAIMRGWYDEVEMVAHTDPQVLGATAGMSFEQVARMYTQAVAAGMLEISPDSSYALEDAKVYTCEVYETIPGDDTQFCFNMLLALKHADIGTVGHYQAGAGTAPIEEPGFEGYHSWGMQVVMRRENGAWHRLDWGGGGYRLENYQ